MAQRTSQSKTQSKTQSETQSETQAETWRTWAAETADADDMADGTNDDVTDEPHADYEYSADDGPVDDAPNGGEPEYYAVLGIAPAASEVELRHAYRRLAKLWHPDRYTAAPAELRARA
ncbi:MAG: J domain-containing protein, partial [Ktedonobacterales bacterium]